jgi:hypothetical protein
MRIIANIFSKVKSKKYLSIIIALAFLLVAIFSLPFLGEYFKKETKQDIDSEKFVPTGEDIKNFYLYLDLPSISGKFMRFDEVESEIHVIYFNKETRKVSVQTFKVDQDTIFSKLISKPRQPNLFSEKELQGIKQETPVTVFYLLAENENQLARLIQVEDSF